MKKERSLRKERPRVGFISGTDEMLKFFLMPYIRAVAKGADVVIITNFGSNTPDFDPEIEYVPMRFKRQASPCNDLIHLFQLSAIVRRKRLDVVYSISPKGGLLGMLAATLARVPVRVHFFTGQVWVRRTGLWRRILKGADQVIGRICSFALVDSHSQRDYLIEEGVVRADKSAVLGAGSVSGIDVTRFSPNADSRAEVRAELGIPDTMPLILFLGRLTRDKGVADLVEAFIGLADAFPDLGLVIAGRDEGMLANLKARLAGALKPKRVWFLGPVSKSERYLAASDILCLPSYREGFGMAVLEAAATGVPAIGSNIYGISDAILDRQTGLLHRAGDPKDLARALERLISDPELRRLYGDAALARARDVFEQGKMIDQFIAFHQRMTSSSRQGSVIPPDLRGLQK